MLHGRWCKILDISSNSFYFSKFDFYCDSWKIVSYLNSCVELEVVFPLSSKSCGQNLTAMAGELPVGKHITGLQNRQQCHMPTKQHTCIYRLVCSDIFNYLYMYLHHKPKVRFMICIDTATVCLADLIEWWQTVLSHVTIIYKLIIWKLKYGSILPWRAAWMYRWLVTSLIVVVWVKTQRTNSNCRFLEPVCT